MIDAEESWMQQIRNIAPIIEKTEYEVFKCEAEVKKLHATLKMQALGTGMKTSSAQETWAETQKIWRLKAECQAQKNLLIWVGL